MWELALTVGLLLIEWFLKDKKRKEEARKKYIEYIQSKKPDINIPASKRSEFEELRDGDDIQRGS